MDANTLYANNTWFQCNNCLYIYKTDTQETMCTCIKFNYCIQETPSQSKYSYRQLLLCWICTVTSYVVSSLAIRPVNINPPAPSSSLRKAWVHWELYTWNLQSIPSSSVFVPNHLGKCLVSVSLQKCILEAKLKGTLISVIDNFFTQWTYLAVTLTIMNAMKIFSQVHFKQWCN